MDRHTSSWALVSYKIRSQKPGCRLGVDCILTLCGGVLKFLNLVHVLFYACQLGEDGMVLSLHPIQA